MTDTPRLTAEQVAELIPGVSEVAEIGRGGQKLVFRAKFNERIYAVKFVKINASEAEDQSDISNDPAAARVRREIEIMRNCQSPHMVRFGPIELQYRSMEEQALLYFMEEFIDGDDLGTIFRRDGAFPPAELVKLGIQIAMAIKELWKQKKVHRDIKPNNIMRRNDSGNYVLLDAGLAFDLNAESLSTQPVGTPVFFSPEQFEFSDRRTLLDFRSDMFSLGLTMYFLGTRLHPFWGDGAESLYSNIRNLAPPLPSTIIPGFPKDLEDVIIRLMGKSPHLRYRTCDMLINALKDLS
jgi:serine/threonine-protein kinase